MIVECPACESRYDVTGRPPGTKARCRCGQLFLLPEPTQSAAALACPQCGANVKTGDSNCEFCQAALLVKACPRCFARIFHGAKHCNLCGCQVEVPASAHADGTAKQLVCPRCSSGRAMVARLVGDTLLDECPECHGTWLDAGAVDRLVSERRQVSTQAVLGMGGPAAANVPKLTPPGRVYLKCPECETVMNRTNFAMRSGIIVDTCKVHGTWFDVAELPQVVAFVMNGGVEASNKATLRRAEEKLRRERAKVRVAQQAASHVDLGHRPAKTSTSSILAGLLDILGSSRD